MAAPHQILPGELAWKHREENGDEASEITDGGVTDQGVGGT